MRCGVRCFLCFTGLPFAIVSCFCFSEKNGKLITITITIINNYERDLSLYIVYRYHITSYYIIILNNVFFFIFVFVVTCIFFYFFFFFSFLFRNFLFIKKILYFN